LYIHNFDRNPEVGGNTGMLHLNNLVYNGGDNVTNRGYLVGIHDAGNDGPLDAVLINNVAKEGPTSSGNGYVVLHESIKPGSRLYHSGNRFAGGVRDETGGAYTFDTVPIPLPDPLTILPTDSVEAHLVANVGARPADRDPVDMRLIADVMNVTGHRISHESEVGGLPALAVHHRALTLPGNPSGDADGDGYTNLEAWLYVFTACVEGRWADQAQCRALQVIQ
jgi:hypothetical protein